MTIIAAAKDHNGTFIASDSMGYSRGNLIELGSKLITIGNYVIGFSGSYRIKNIIEECKKLPKKITDIKGIRKVRDELKAIFEDDQSLARNSEGDYPFALIIVIKNGIYVIGSDFQILEIEDYVAIGSGEDFGMGAMAYKCDAYISVRLAVDAAKKHSAFCGGKTHFKSVD